MDLYQDKQELFKELNNSSTLVIVFGGIKQGLGIPVYEFMNLLRGFKFDKVFIRDLSQSWYQNGIFEANSIFKLKKRIESIIKQGSYKKVFFIGNSMGGYAAIMFGSLIGVNEVISFSPQTFLKKSLRKRYKDYRWKDEILKIKYIFFKRKILDLKKLESLIENKNLHIEIHYSLRDRLDSVHAARVKSIKGVTLYPYNFGNHNLVKELRDKGTLSGILNKKFGNNY
ncbi:YqiA/YcfP family alpha/beta fold hydrolase [uncultured Algibacter sp.]|uniref:YqiA/YcfP family alpha/beta fold hydrolase n=1 Tax=uncultured Algibacter sp. TaxID=298659 RepID=UPI00260A6CEA|nr:YqiA/YcfP family alpha/beta fold hydrolase [uncultured Algibacter sp.]